MLIDGEFIKFQGLNKNLNKEFLADDTHAYFRPHLKNMHFDEDIICLQCGNVSISKLKNILHLTRSHPEYSDDRKLICPICNVGQKPQGKEMYDHLRFDHFGHKRPECSECGKKFNRNHQLKNHMTSHKSERNFECQECHAKFKTKDHLRNHKNWHKNDEKVSCDQCGKLFKAKSTLRTHVRTVHEAVTEGLLHICDICGKSYKSEFRLKGHHKEVHTKKETLICPYEECQKPYNGKAALNSHVKAVHIGRKKNHPCSYCGKMFTSPADVKKHENTIHLNVRSLKCDQCDYSTNYSSSLSEHIQAAHQGVMFDCDYPGCTKSYNAKGNLYAHRWRVHKIPRPYSKF